MQGAQALEGRTAGMATEDINAERAAMPGDNVFIEALRGVAWNDTLKSAGYEKRRETWAQRLMRALA